MSSFRGDQERPEASRDGAMTPETPTCRSAPARLLGLLLALGPVPAAAQVPLVLPGPPEGPAPDRCRPIAPGGGGATPVTLYQSFHDEFDDFDLYGGLWTPHFDHNGYRDWRARTLEANGEAQLYVDPRYAGSGARPLGLDPFSAGDGVLGLVARPTPAPAGPYLHGFRYVSGMLSSRDSFVQRLGYFEIRARLPAGAGLWPAFWLLSPGAWPPEIDVMEARGTPGYRVTVHWEESGAHVSSGCEIPLADASEAFHSYGVLWSTRALVFYLDGTPMAWIAAKPGFDRPMYLLANLAVGGWAGEPDARTMFPATYEIDRIAAYLLPEAGG